MSQPSRPGPCLGLRRMRQLPWKRAVAARIQSVENESGDTHDRDQVHGRTDPPCAYPPDLTRTRRHSRFVANLCTRLKTASFNAKYDLPKYGSIAKLTNLSAGSHTRRMCRDVGVRSYAGGANGTFCRFINTGRRGGASGTEAPHG